MFYTYKKPSLMWTMSKKMIFYIICFLLPGIAVLDFHFVKIKEANSSNFLERDCIRTYITQKLDDYPEGKNQVWPHSLPFQSYNDSRRSSPMCVCRADPLTSSHLVSSIYTSRIWVLLYLSGKWIQRKEVSRWGASKESPQFKGQIRD